MRALSMVWVLLAATAGAAPLDTVSVGDLPGSDGRWQHGEVTIAAPAAEVQRWFSDASHWRDRFPDNQQVRVMGTAPDGRQVVEFHSAVLGRTLTVRLREQPGLITYDGSGKNVTTQGKLFFEAVGPDRTRIEMQTTAELHGVIGAVASQGMKRKRALAKLNADLNAAVNLSRAGR
jgi:carbon monoxide dehydrogenase subunit G